nr:disease resistance protein At4g27190-like [Ziziphus jujuba var. spinosa]
MEYLMRYGMGWDMFKHVYTLDEARDKVYSLVDQLKDCSLLLDGDNYGTVKMHDVIWDVAISIAKENYMYSFRNVVEVEECQRRKTLEGSKAISLPNGYVDQFISKRLEYKQLVLIWMWENKSIQIPDNLGDIALIGDLNKLEILDLSQSNIEEIPTQIGQLTGLRMLDLTGCSNLKVIQPHIISRLIHLEELYVKQSFKNWDQVEVVSGERINASLIELKCLVRLTSLHLEIVDVKMLPKDLFSEKLERYKVSIQGAGQSSNDDDGFNSINSEVSAPRHLEINLNESSLLQELGLEMLLKRSQVLCLNGLEGVNNIVYDLDKKGSPELQCFQLRNNVKIQYLINTMEQIHPCSAFRSLDSLFLDNLINLEKICHEELKIDSFERLRVIEVRNLSFEQLNSLEVRDCMMMEEIMSRNERMDKMSFLKLDDKKLLNLPNLTRFCSTILIELPTLTKLSIEDFPEFKTFICTSEENICTTISSLFNEKVSFSSLNSLEIIRLAKF